MHTDSFLCRSSAAGASEEVEDVPDTVPVDGSEVPTDGGNVSSESQDSDETPNERRLRESQAVLERVQYIHNLEVRCAFGKPADLPSRKF
jgi:hypothetical protein